MPTVETEVLARMRSVHVEELMLPLLIQLVTILAAARLCGTAARRLGHPAVVGEIVSGLLLGPSVLGLVSPWLFHLLFRPTVGGLPAEAADLMLGNVLTVLSQVGLVLL